MSDVLRVLLADDEPLALERLVFAFRDLPGSEVVATATNGLEAAALIAELAPDVAILDIQMPGRTGLGVAAGIAGAGRTQVIFVTAHEHHAVDAFDVDAADYLLKPLRVDRLRLAMERARRRRVAMAPNAPATPSCSPSPATGADAVAPAAAADPAGPAPHDPAFWVPTRSGTVRVRFDEVDWIEAAKDYVMLHTRTRSHILRATMSAIASRVSPQQFVRVHRSAFVRPAAVRRLHPTSAGGAVLELVDDVAVPVGPSYLSEVARRFAGRR